MNETGRTTMATLLKSPAKIREALRRRGRKVSTVAAPQPIPFAFPAATGTYVGTGQVLGAWVVERIEETQRFFLGDGRPRSVAFRLDLAVYGDDA